MKTEVYRESLLEMLKLTNMACYRYVNKAYLKITPYDLSLTSEGSSFSMTLTVLAISDMAECITIYPKEMFAAVSELKKKKYVDIKVDGNFVYLKTNKVKVLKIDEFKDNEIMLVDGNITARPSARSCKIERRSPERSKAISDNVTEGGKFLAGFKTVLPFVDLKNKVEAGKGVNLSSSGGATIFTAINDQEVCRCSQQIGLPEGLNVTISLASAKMLLRLMEDIATNVRVFDQYLQFEGVDFILTADIIKDKFPDVSRYFDIPIIYKITFSKTPLLREMSNMECKIVTFLVTESYLMIKNKEGDLLHTSKISNEFSGFETSVNVKQFSRFLKNCPGEIVTIGFTKDFKMSNIFGKDNECRYFSR